MCYKRSEEGKGMEKWSPVANDCYQDGRQCSGGKITDIYQIYIVPFLQKPQIVYLSSGLSGNQSLHFFNLLKQTLLKCGVETAVEPLCPFADDKTLTLVGDGTSQKILNWNSVELTLSLSHFKNYNCSFLHQV